MTDTFPTLPTTPAATEAPRKESLLSTLKDRLHAEKSGKNTGAIISAVEMSAADFYSQGDPAKAAASREKYGDRYGLAVTIARADHAGAKHTFNQFFHMPRDEGALDGTHLGLFMERYKDVPKVGMTVNVRPEEGLWKIVLDRPTS